MEEKKERKKIGHVERQKGTMCWVDGNGDVWEQPFKRKKKKEEELS